MFIPVSHSCMSAGILKETSELKPESVRNDVDQDVFLMFKVVDENMSWYLEENIQRALGLGGVNTDDPEFAESNLMHGERQEF